jgi:hypothetical protein
VGATTGGVTNAGASTTGGALSVGGYPIQVGGFMSYGGYPVQAGGHPTAQGGSPNTGGAYVEFGGYPVAWGGYPPNTGGTETGGAWQWGNGGSETGGAYSEPPPNGATCLCLLAESLRVAGGWQTAGCSSDDPNNCTLQKAFCGQTCAGNASCGESCIATFSSQVFNDAATYSYGSCNVIIRCPAPSS